MKIILILAILLSASCATTEEIQDGEALFLYE